MMKILTWCLALVAALAFFVGSPAWAYDRTEAENCGGCHFEPKMALVVEMWLESNHADSFHGFNGNTYCAECHAPMEADPLATDDDNDLVPFEEWQAVTCAACHPPHSLRVLWETPIATYDITTGEYSPLYVDEGEADLLCVHCHTGVRHAGKDFQGFGKAMHKKDVDCIDCHMAKVPRDVEETEVQAYTHDFNVMQNLPWSCGTYVGGCHSNHSEVWALKQLQKGKIHGKDKTH